MIKDILKYFQLNYEDLITKMKNSNHHLLKSDLSEEEQLDYPNKKIIHINPYHLEGDIWTHTMMVLKQAQLNNGSLEVQLAALLHDVGKPTVRTITNNNRVAFYNHENISTQLSISILKDFKENLNIDFDMLMTLKLINFHSDFHNKIIFNENLELNQKSKLFLNQKYNNKTFLKNMIILNKSDNGGRFTETEDIENTLNKFKILENYKANKPKIIDKSKLPKFIILTGLPCAGKSTMINELLKKDDYVVISSDNLIKEKYPDLNYDEAFSQVLNNNEYEDLDKLLYKNLQKAIKANKNIIVDQTNMSKKSRRRKISLASPKKYLRINNCLLVNDSILVERNKLREGKNISNKVFNMMKKNFFIPDYDEPFDEINYYIDGKKIKDSNIDLIKTPLKENLKDR